MPTYTSWTPPIGPAGWGGVRITPRAYLGKKIEIAGNSCFFSPPTKVPRPTSNLFTSSLFFFFFFLFLFLFLWDLKLSHSLPQFAQPEDPRYGILSSQRHPSANSEPRERTIFLPLSCFLSLSHSSFLFFFHFSSIFRFSTSWLSWDWLETNSRSCPPRSLHSRWWSWMCVITKFRTSLRSMTFRLSRNSMRRTTPFRRTTSLSIMPLRLSSPCSTTP